MKTKLTTTEKRALALCESIRRGITSGITVEWIDSRTWGSNPRIMHHGEKVTNISGCGYCKHSACLASALADLGRTEEEKRAIASKQGAGVSAVRDALKAAGWELVPVSSGKRFDCYTITPTQS